MDIKSYIIQRFEHNIEQEGSFWRLARPDTFIDLLMLQAGKASKKGIDNELAIEVVLIAIKALINRRLGIKEYTPDYKRLNKELFNDLNNVHTEANRVLACILLKVEEAPKSLSSTDELNYFKVLNNLEINTYTLDIFEHVLIVFLGYIIAENQDVI